MTKSPVWVPKQTRHLSIVIEYLEPLNIAVHWSDDPEYYAVSVPSRT